MRSATPTGGRLAVAAVLGLALLAGGARLARAQVEVPKGNFGAALQLGQNTGAAGETYRLAWMFGVTAGYEPARIAKLAIGASWSLTGGQYFDAADGLPDTTIGVLDMSMGLRVRRLLGETTPRFVVLEIGGTLLRVGRAVPPDNNRLYAGPYAAVGVDQYLGRVLVSFAARYGLIGGTGPGNLGLRISFSLGS